MLLPITKVNNVNPVFLAILDSSGSRDRRPSKNFFPGNKIFPTKANWDKGKTLPHSEITSGAKDY